MKRLSIIIPFYNVEQYIAQCLDSVYNQDIPEEDYEVICVNDGSPDRSRDIVMEYQKQHKNLILVEHEHNKKLGAARNTGRAIAQGKYIWNVDSDDLIVPNCLGRILSVCEQEDLDVLVFNICLYRKENGIFKAYSTAEIAPYQLCSGLQFLNDIKTAEFSRIAGVWRQVFRREFLNNNDIYSPLINMGEDIPYTHKAIILAERLRVVSDEYYYYRDAENSILRQMNREITPYYAYQGGVQSTIALYPILLLISDKTSKVYRREMNLIKYSAYRIFDYVNSMSKNKRHLFAILCRSNLTEFLSIFPLFGFRKKLKLLRILLY